MTEQLLEAREERVQDVGAQRRTRVLYLMLRPDPEMYGGTRSILAFLERQRAVDPYVVVAAADPDDPAMAELARLGVPHEYFPAGPIMAARNRGGAAARLQRMAMLVGINLKLLAVIRRVRPDVVHADYEGMTLIGPAARMAGRVLVQHLRSGRTSARLGMVLGATMLMADRTVVVSEGLRDECVRRMGPRLKRRVLHRLVPVFNGVRLDRLAAYRDSVTREEARAALSIPPDQVAVGIVGGIFDHKGQKEFLEEVAPRVAAADPRVHFYLVGGVKDEEYARACRAAAERAPVAGRVTFVGWQDDVYRWYRALDIMAFPSLVEGFGRVAVEAQAFGVPVVGADVAGIRDTLGEGAGGYLASSAEETARHLVALAADPALRAAMGRRGMEFVWRFDVDRVTHELESVYAGLER